MTLKVFVCPDVEGECGNGAGAVGRQVPGSSCGKIQRNDMGWEVGGGFRIGSSCTPVADSCQCTAKAIQFCKAKLSKN